MIPDVVVGLISGTCLGIVIAPVIQDWLDRRGDHR